MKSWLARFMTGGSCIVLAIAGCGDTGATLPAGTSLLTVEPSDDPPSIELFGLPKDEPPLPSTIAGIFTEHLGRNVYGGAWAQVLFNPVMAPVNMFGGGPRVKSGIPPRPEFESLQQIPRTVEVNRMAFGWLPCGNVRSYTLAGDSAAGGPFRQDVTTGTGGPLNGIMTPAYFPSHRTGHYKLLIKIRASANGPPVTAGIYPVRKGLVDLDEPLAGPVTLSQGTDALQEIMLQADRRQFPADRLAVFAVGTRKSGTFSIERTEVYPDDALDGWDPEVVGLWRKAGIRLLRFPGGNFTSGYHWKDGTGPRAERPIRKNPAWFGCEFNTVGVDEWLRFCDLIGAEALICVNAGNGTPQEAADWVEYCNAAADTPMGQRRAADGHPAPYRVRFWEVGNELYGAWQIGHATAEEYAGRYDTFARAMRERDASIRLLANGNNLDWDRILVREIHEPLRTLTVHRLIGGVRNQQAVPDDVFRAVVANPVYFERELAPSIRDALQQRTEDPHLAVTEFMVFEGRPVYPNNHSISEALYYAGMMDAAVRSRGFLDILTHTALLNHGGGMIKDRGIVFAEPVYHAVAFYASLVNGRPLALRVQCPVEDSPEALRLPAVTQVPEIDAVAILSSDSRRLICIVMNRSMDKARDVAIRCGPWVDAVSEGRLSLLSASDYTEQNTIDAPDRIRVVESAITAAAGSYTVHLPEHSLAKLEWTMASR